jgi:hypothetical protein
VDLERALRESWNTADLAVYGDHLQTLGDPRGELIALDLQPRPEDPRWQARRAALHERWLGEEAEWLATIARHAFVYEVRAQEHPHTILESPLGAFVRSYSTWWENHTIAYLEQLASRPRPWLTRLAYFYEGTERRPALCDAILAAAPNLVEVYEVGDRLLDHPKRVDGEPPSIGPALRLDPETLQRYLAAIDREWDCNKLQLDVGSHDTLPALLVRLNQSEVVELTGPIVRVTPLGHAILRWPRTTSASPLPPPVMDGVLCLEDPIERDDPDDTPGQRCGQLRGISALIATCLARMPIDEDTARRLVEMQAFLRTITAPPRAYPGKPPVEALRQLVSLHELGDRGFALFDDLGDDEQWRHFNRFVRFLEWIDRATFRVE